MNPEKPNILFIHASWPNQFSLLHKHFQQTQTANSLFLITEHDRNYFSQHDKEFPAGVIAYTPDGDMGPHSYYYSGPAEKNARHGMGILNACKTMAEIHSIDLIMVHAILGPPHMLFDEIDVPIISYVEFPSFRHHQWDPQYPPHDGQRYCDKYEETLNYYAALKSDLVITPSEYAKKMFPAVLQEKIAVQMDGFDPKKIPVRDPSKSAFEKAPGHIYVGFFASTLSSEKGLEQFIIVSKRLAEINPNIRFVLMGDAKGISYCYENLFLENRFGKESEITFKDYLFSKYAVDESLYICTGRLDMLSFSSTIYEVDFFLYPLQFGSANWGLYELLLRGKIVVASDRCFLPEIITDGQNGFLRDYDDIEGWVKLCQHIATHLEEYKPIGERAAQSVKKLYIENVAKNYLRIFSDTIEKRKRNATR